MDKSERIGQLRVKKETYNCDFIVTQKCTKPTSLIQLSFMTMHYIRITFQLISI